MNRIIEVTVSPTGETSVQTKGYAGAACQQASAWLEQALGLAVNERKTAEFFEQSSNPQRQESQT